MQGVLYPGNAGEEVRASRFFEAATPRLRPRLTSEWGREMKGSPVADVEVTVDPLGHCGIVIMFQYMYFVFLTC